VAPRLRVLIFLVLSSIVAVYWWKITLCILMTVLGGIILLIGVAFVFHKQIERYNQRGIENEIDTEDDTDS
jgi:hypothetical protein